MSNETLDKLLGFITESFMVEREEIELDKSMVDEGIIDSFGLVEISSFLTSEYGVKITEDDFTRENFGSVLKIVAFVEKRVGSQTS